MIFEIARDITIYGYINICKFMYIKYKRLVLFY